MIISSDLFRVLKAKAATFMVSNASILEKHIPVLKSLNGKVGFYIKSERTGRVMWFMLDSYIYEYGQAIYTKSCKELGKVTASKFVSPELPDVIVLVRND